MRFLSALSAFALLFALCASPALAQQQTEPPAPDQKNSAQQAPAQSERDYTLVRFTMKSHFASAEDDDDVRRLPSALMQRLTDQHSLEKLNVQAEGRRITLKAHFAFESMGAFSQWYQRDETRELIQAVNAQSPSGDTQIALDLTRH